MRLDRRAYDLLQVRGRPAAYALAVASAAAMVLVRIGLAQITPGIVPFALLFPAILLSSVVGGPGPGFVALGVGLALTLAFASEAEPVLFLGEPAGWINLAVFVLTATMVIEIAAMLRSVSRRFEKAQRDHLQGEHRLMMALEAGRLGTFWYDLATRRGGWSDAVAGMFGLPATVLGGSARDWFDLIVPEDRGAAEEALGAAAARPDGSYGGEFRIRRPDGEIRWIEFRGRILDDGQGRPTRLEGVAQDTTERRRQDERLARLMADLSIGEERLRLAVESMGLGMWDLDVQRGTRLWSPEMRRILGLGMDAPETPETFMARVHPDDIGMVMAKTASFYAPGGNPRHDAEFRIRRLGDGEERWVIVRGRMYRDAQGRPTRGIGTILDVTDLKRAQQAAEESRTRVTLATEAAGLGIFEHDLEKDVALWENERMYELFGRCPDLGPLTLKELESEVVHPDDRAAFATEVATVAAKGERLHTQFRIRVPGGTRTLELFGHFRKGPDGAAARMIGTLADVTEATQSKRRREMLIHELRHRVKNVLATIQAIARSSFPDGIDTADGLQNFTSRLMAYSKAHDVLTRQGWRDPELREVLREAIEPFQGPAQGQDRFALKGPVVLLTPRRALALSMALHELCTNAAKYGALSVPSGRVRIVWTVERESGGDRLRIRWSELDGPPVAAPLEKGFGTRLIERGLAMELDGTVRLDYRPDGVVCEIEARLGEGGAPATAEPRALSKAS